MPGLNLYYKRNRLINHDLFSFLYSISSPVIPSSSSSLLPSHLPVGLPSPLAAVALGSNLEINSGSNKLTCQQILRAALEQLGQTPGIQVMAQSHLYETAPIGPPQPNFINGCALLQVNVTPHSLLQTLLTIEQQFGRIRTQYWGPRTLDLDLIFYDQQVCHSPSLTLPHPRLAERAFVLLPLAEIAPNWRDPVTGKTITELAKAVNWSGIDCLLPI